MFVPGLGEHDFQEVLARCVAVFHDDVFEEDVGGFDGAFNVGEGCVLVDDEFEGAATAFLKEAFLDGFHPGEDYDDEQGCGGGADVESASYG